MALEGSSSVEDYIKVLQDRQDSTKSVLQNMSKMLSDLASKMDALGASNASLSILGRHPGFDSKKAQKKNMPKFNGEDVEGWLYKVKKYFRFHNVLEGEWIMMATMNMEGKALKGLLWMDGEG